MRFYRALLHLYPASFRAEYGEEMAAVFRARLRDAGAAGRLGLLASATFDVAANAAAVHADLLRQDLVYTARTLRRAAGFTVTAIVIVGIGIGANVAAFSLTDFVLLRPLPFPSPERLVTVTERMPGYPRMEMSPSNFRDWKPAATSFEYFGVHTPVSANLVGSGEPLRLDGTAITVDALSALGVSPALGRRFVTGEDAVGAAATVIISDHLWRAAFGADPGIVGRTIVLDDVPREVIGVMPREFGYPTRRMEFWIPLSFPPNTFVDRGNNYLRGIARLKPGVSVEGARAEMDAIAARSRAQYPKENENVATSVTPLRDETARQARVMVAALSAAAFCVLLIVCANLANLLLARALGRRQELAVRTALGAGRERLARQLSTESLVLAVSGGALGIVVARAMVPLLWRLVPAALPTASTPAVDLRVLGFAAFLTIVTAIAFGLAPMLRGRAGDVTDLREGGRTTGSGRERLRGALVAAEVTASIVLLVVTGLLVRALWNIQHTDPGFNPEHVLTVRTTLPLPKYAVTSRRFAFYERVLGEIQALPGVQRAAYITGVPMVARGGIWPVTIDGKATGRTDEQTVSVRFVTPGFFETMQVPMRSGHDVRESDVMESEPVAVVSESFARRYWPGQDPLGRGFNVALSDRVVVGVVGDIRVRGLEAPSEPQVYLPYKQVADGWFPNFVPKDLVVRSALPFEQLVPAVRRIIHDADPQQPLSDIRPMTEIIEGETASRSLQVRVLSGFAIVAFLLAAIGIHGVLSFAVSQRTPEIGVRIALGAQRRDIVRMIGRHGLVLLAAGLVPGVALAYAAARALDSLLIGVRPGDLPTFATAVAVTTMMAVLGTLLPALRAVRIDPLRAMRSE
jgi:putative ABC transport system permease protein